VSFGKGRALVTGGAGLIGSHLVDLLIEKGYEVTILDSLEKQSHRQGKPDWINPHADFIEGDVRNESDVRRSLEGTRFVFHQAAFGGFTEHISKYFDVNVGGTARIFELIASESFPVEKVIVASSQAVYGEGFYECAQHGILSPPARTLAQFKNKQWNLLCPKCGNELKTLLTGEERVTDGRGPYALSKEFEEKLALSCGERLGIPVVALRYGVTYGPRQSIFNPYTGVVSIFSTRLLNNLRPVVYEDGEQMRDFVYVGDIVKANLFALESADTNGQVFNVGTGKPTKILDLVRILGSLYGRVLEPEIPGEFRWGDVRHMLLASEKLNRFGFKATVSLNEGLGHFVDWIKSQGSIEEYFSDAYQDLKKRRIIASS